ncbi:MAG: glycoside hydrolase family 97 protein [Microscillaceae bacterium]|nr:glycoside hydrolase family 97 protein [Microscillaceae bacterium]MDW8461588.1 glycoside hydrolase family 97 protein [Cytophagales bacterium]
MKKLTYFCIVICLLHGFFTLQAQDLLSPNGQIKLNFSLKEGKPTYQVWFKNKPIVQESYLGLVFKTHEAMVENFQVIETKTQTFDETWQPVWGEVREIRNHYNELALTLQQPTGQKLILRFRAFNDGIGFRYEVPFLLNTAYAILSDETTQFNLAANHTAYWIPGDYDTNEYRYTVSRLSEVSTQEAMRASEIGVRTPFHPSAVQTPLMLKTDDKIYLNIHEAALVNYPAMQLVLDKSRFLLQCHLVPNILGDKAYLQAPFQTPWRTLIISDKATDILASKLILNLNEPSIIKDTDWIKPQKFVGVWWEMHIGTGTWNYANNQNIVIGKTNPKDLKPNGKHAANTQNVKKYIDFAAKHGFQSVLVEGWNIGWEDWFGNWKENVFDFVTPYPDFDVQELQQYAQQKGVKLIMHHETSGSATNYERRLDEAFRFMKQYGYETVKTGYVGKIIPRGEYHDGQWMVNHYEYVARKAAENKIMIDSHESVRPTGLHRTYPNWLAAEAARGNEFNAWSIGNPPNHETILPFTRLIGGPMDYTPGIFQIRMSHYNPNSPHQIHTTLAKQLALYVTMYSPLQMAADLPENYEQRLDAFQFIKDVPVDWDDTQILEAEPAQYITIARKAKNSPNWFLGAITNENTRNLNIPLTFLDKNQTYKITIYADAPDADFEHNPMAYQIQTFLADSTSVLKAKLARSGGLAASLVPATQEDKKKYKKLK